MHSTSNIKSISTLTSYSEEVSAVCCRCVPHKECTLSITKHTHTHILSVVTEDILIRKQSKLNSPHSALPRHKQAESLSCGKTYTKQQTGQSDTFPPDTPFLKPATIKP